MHCFLDDVELDCYAVLSKKVQKIHLISFRVERFIIKFLINVF